MRCGSIWLFTTLILYDNTHIWCQWLCRAGWCRSSGITLLRVVWHSGIIWRDHSRASSRLASNRGLSHITACGASQESRVMHGSRLRSASVTVICRLTQHTRWCLKLLLAEPSVSYKSDIFCKSRILQCWIPRDITLEVYQTSILENAVSISILVAFQHEIFLWWFSDNYSIEIATIFLKIA